MHPAERLVVVARIETQAAGLEPVGDLRSGGSGSPAREDGRRRRSSRASASSSTRPRWCGRRTPRRCAGSGSAGSTTIADRPLASSAEASARPTSPPPKMMTSARSMRACPTAARAMTPRSRLTARAPREGILRANGISGGGTMATAAARAPKRDLAPDWRDALRASLQALRRAHLGRAADRAQPRRRRSRSPPTARPTRRSAPPPAARRPIGWAASAPMPATRCCCCSASARSCSCR